MRREQLFLARLEYPARIRPSAGEFARLITAIVPPALRSTVEHAVTTLPAPAIPFAAGLAGLLFSGTGVVFSAYQTLNHVAAVPHRLRAGFVSRYVRVFVMLATLLTGAVAVGTLTVMATACRAARGLLARRSGGCGD